jgi:hypothetical protein
MNNPVPLVMVIGLNGSRSMFAATEYHQLREEISRNISYPDFAKAFHLEGIVNVGISTDNTGQVTVSESNASHEGLLEYVVSHLKKMIIGDEEYREREYKLMLKFKMY